MTFFFLKLLADLLSLQCLSALTAQVILILYFFSSSQMSQHHQHFLIKVVVCSIVEYTVLLHELPDMLMSLLLL
jgi:hypothetical protein